MLTQSLLPLPIQTFFASLPFLRDSAFLLSSKWEAPGLAFGVRNDSQMRPFFVFTR
jgi:hypothetical protein